MGLSELLMNQPELNEDGTEYLRDGKSLTRVTQIVNKVLPPYLAPWAEGVGHKAALEVYKRDGQLPGTAEELKKKAIEYGLTCEDEKQAGGDRGSALHLAIEAAIRSGHPISLEDFDDPSHRLYAQSFAEFWLDYRPEFHEAEVRVSHKDLGYAGTFDAVATLRNRPKGARGPDLTGKTVILDWKSNANRKVYDTHLIQLCAYELACQTWGVEVDGSAVVAIGPKRDKGKSYAVRANYMQPEMFAQVVAFYNLMAEQKALNPAARKKK